MYHRRNEGTDRLMAIVRESNFPASLPQTDSDVRGQYKLNAQARLSGAATSDPACNPVSLSVPSFSRVTHISFEEHAPARRVAGVQVAEDDLDW